MIRTMYRAVKAIKIAIGWGNFCSTRIKFRPVILLAFPLFLASCQKLDDWDAASSSLTDALRSETTVRPLDLLTSVDSWQLVSYQQPIPSPIRRGPTPVCSSPPTVSASTAFPTFSTTLRIASPCQKKPFTC